ncbi:NAD(P)-binding protein [Bombardia bombarda]|uniref:NAD(P)-binding protein n=1 Tax=Bombardia bombarda TaxID=252184 RepID=A0AA39X6M9_9PEZI|nr:NAD(P)-binding protein [Bombardia bombarda]
MSANPPRVLIIGAGSRGGAYARAIRASGNGMIVAVAEPDEYKRTQFGRNNIWGEGGLPAEGADFGDWRDFVAYEKQRRARIVAGDADTPPGIDAVFVCVLDEMHRDVVMALASLGGLHIMCEKPLATNLQDCVDMYRALGSNRNNKGEQMVFSIGHVLRYSPHNMLLRKLLLEDRVIGDILSVVHTEPVGWWHFTHSYVRGNWRRESTTAPTLLTKSCHDIDVLLWLLCSPPSCSAPGSPPPHLPSTVSSTGSLQYFKKSRKPVAAGSATNCLSCPIETSCKYSAKRIYVSEGPVGLDGGNTAWPVSVVVPDIESYGEVEARRGALLSELAKDYDAGAEASLAAQRNWFGRCVYESDNDVCDEQIVTMAWEEDPLPLPSPSGGASGYSDPMRGRGAKTATFHMVAQTKQVCHRYTNLYGVDGEIFADSSTITFMLAVDKVKNDGWTTEKAQEELVGCTLEEVMRSHAMVFCAEDARRGKKVIDWVEWWARLVQGKLGQVPK